MNHDDSTASEAKDTRPHTHTRAQNCAERNEQYEGIANKFVFVLSVLGASFVRAKESSSQ